MRMTKEQCNELAEKLNLVGKYRKHWKYFSVELLPDLWLVYRKPKKTAQDRLVALETGQIIKSER